MNTALGPISLILSLVPLQVAAQPPLAGASSVQDGGTSESTRNGRETRCRIEGQVVNSSTGDPVRKASLVLRRSDESSNAVNLSKTYSTSTDAEGKFAMKDVEPGTYRLLASRTGFVSGEYGARGPMRPGIAISLSPGQRLQDLPFPLTPHGIITGRVLDEGREPIANVQVRTLWYGSSRARKHPRPAGTAITNDLGEYRISGLHPGRYQLNAVYRSGMMLGPAVDASGSQPPSEDYVPVYYPNATDPDAAISVDVTAGAQLQGLDFVLSKVHTVRVKGRVNDAAGAGRQGIRVSMISRGRTGSLNISPARATDSNGAFEFRAVPPGSYTLMASFFDGDKLFTARQRLEAGSNDLELPVITISPGMELSGRVRVDSQTKASVAGVRVSLRSREAGDPTPCPLPISQLREDGRFALTNICTDFYDFALQGLPEGFYVKAMRAGDEDILSAGLDLNRGPAGPIDIVLSPNAGQIDGMALNEKQQPAAGSTIVLIPQERDRRDKTLYYRSVTTDLSGRFTLKSLDPGEYKVYAWEDVEYGSYFDPEFVKPVEDQGASVTIRENSRETLQLKLILEKNAEGLDKVTR
jgi:hypothetical protein